MSNPQQPELARSRKTPSQDQDAVAGVVDGQRVPGTSGDAGPLPAENQPGHHPPEEQDRPDLDAFAHRLGVPDEHGEAPPAPEADEASVIPVASARSRFAAVGAGVAAIVVALLLIRRRRRAR